MCNNAHSKELKDLFPKEILEATNVNFLRDVRDFVDNLVQEAKRKRDEANIQPVKEKYEGKFIIKYGYKWDGPISIENKNNIFLAKIKKIQFVGNGFFRCSAIVFEINFGFNRNTSLSSEMAQHEYEDVSVSSYEDINFDIRTEKNYKVISDEDALALIKNAAEKQKNVITWFQENAF